MTTDIQDEKATLNNRYAGRLAIVVLHYVYRGRGRADTWTRTYDVAKLLELDEFEISYVARHIAAAIESSDNVVDTTSSIKYSFQDCEDWYSSCELASIPDNYAVKTLHIESSTW